MYCKKCENESHGNSGTLIFSYNESSGIVTLSIGSEKSDLRFIALQYAMNLL